MSKSDKFYNRLIELEKEFKKLLIQELEELSRSSYSSYLNARSTRYYIGKKSKSSDIIVMEKLEEEIIHLREKTFGNIQNSIVQLSEALARIYKNRYKFSKNYIISIGKNIVEQLLKVENDDYSIIIESLNQVEIPDYYHETKDVIVKAKNNRFFPMPFRELADLLDKLKINNANGRRLSIELCNPPINSMENFPLLQVIPQCCVIINSFPVSFDEELSKKMLKTAIQNIDKNLNLLTCKSSGYISMIFRITNDGRILECLKREVKYKKAKYRGRDKFSNSCNPQGKTVKEKLLESIKLRT